MKTKDPIRKKEKVVKTKVRKAGLTVLRSQLSGANLGLAATGAPEPVKPQSPEALASASLEEMVELFPHGISVGTSLGRPVLVLKDKKGIDVLPVWMQPLDAGVALAELSHGSGSTPHAVVRRLFEVMNLKMESCVFSEVIGNHQFVDLSFSSPSVGASAGVSLEGSTSNIRLTRVRADEAMSFCLQARGKFLATREYMARCRSLDGDLTQLENSLNQGLLPELRTEMEISSKKHPYVM